MHEIPFHCPFYSLNTKYTSKQQLFKTKFQVKFVCQNGKGTFQFFRICTAIVLMRNQISPPILSDNSWLTLHIKRNSNANNAIITWYMTNHSKSLLMLSLLELFQNWFLNWVFGPSRVREPAQRNGHYTRHYFLSLSLSEVSASNPRRGCHRVPTFCMSF